MVCVHIRVEDVKPLFFLGGDGVRGDSTVRRALRSNWSACVPLSCLLGRLGVRGKTQFAKFPHLFRTADWERF